MTGGRRELGGHEQSGASIIERATALVETHHLMLPPAGSFAITSSTPHAEDCPGCVLHDLLARLSEAERVIRVTAGWNTDRVSPEEIVAAARSYLAWLDLEAKRGR